MQESQKCKPYNVKTRKKTTLYKEDGEAEEAFLSLKACVVVPFLIFVGSIVCLLCIGNQLFQMWIDDKNTEKSVIIWEDLAEDVQKSKENGDIEVVSGWGIDYVEEKKEKPVVNEDSTIATYSTGSDINVKGSDPVAYINIVGTSISYPVMWSETAGYYLDHGSDGRKNRNGAIYLSELNSPDFSDPVNYIFGHNMDSGLMFRKLNSFLNADFLTEHNQCLLMIGGNQREYRLFYADVMDKNEKIEFYSEDALGTGNYENYVKKITEKSGVEIDGNDELICLITCNTGDRNKRTVVYGYLIKE